MLLTKIGCHDTCIEISGHFVMFVDIFLKNEKIDFDKNHLKCKTRGLRYSFSWKLRICLTKQPNLWEFGLCHVILHFDSFFFIKFEEEIARRTFFDKKLLFRLS